MEEADAEFRCAPEVAREGRSKGPGKVDPKATHVQESSIIDSANTH